MRRPKRLYRNMRLKFSSSLLVTFVCVVLLTELIKRRRSILYSSDRPDGVGKVYTAYQLPGQFFGDALPSNESYCNYKYGLPSAFEYAADDVREPPQLGAASPYRVLYHVINGSGAIGEQIPQVTYCTHMTPDYIYHLSEIVRFWEGPISATVFVPSVDAEISVRHLNRLCRCLPEMYRVSVHFAFPIGVPPTSSAAAATDVADCTVPDLDGVVTYRGARSMIYPVNVGRNAARAGAQTRYVLVSDVELIPSEMLASKFLDMLRRLRYKRRGAKSAAVSYVFVVPVFEVEDTEQVPIRKSELKEMFDVGTAVHFHKWTCLHCQRFPGLHRWFKRKSDAYVKPFLIVRREFPYHRWEPVYIGTNDEPLYSETLSWEGQQDKMTQMLEMCLLEYRFVILDGAFLVHRPGIKRRATNVDDKQQPGSDTWRRPHEQQNTKQYATIINALATKYVENKRCRLT